MCMKYVVEKLKQLRIERGVSQYELADMMGVSPSAVSRWETGQSEIPLSLLELYVRSLGMPMYEFFADLAKYEYGGAMLLAEFNLLVYSEDAYLQIIRLVLELGITNVTFKVNNL